MTEKELLEKQKNELESKMEHHDDILDIANQSLNYMQRLVKQSRKKEEIDQDIKKWENRNSKSLKAMLANTICTLITGIVGFPLSLTSLMIMSCSFIGLTAFSFASTHYCIYKQNSFINERNTLAKHKEKVKEYEETVQENKKELEKTKEELQEVKTNLSNLQKQEKKVKAVTDNIKKAKQVQQEVTPEVEPINPEEIDSVESI